VPAIEKPPLSLVSKHRKLVDLSETQPMDEMDIEGDDRTNRTGAASESDDLLRCHFA